MLNFLTSSQNLTPFDKNQTVPTAKLFPAKYKKLPFQKFSFLSSQWVSNGILISTEKRIIIRGNHVLVRKETIIIYYVPNLCALRRTFLLLAGLAV